MSDAASTFSCDRASRKNPIMYPPICVIGPSCKGRHRHEASAKSRPAAGSPYSNEASLLRRRRRPDIAQACIGWHGNMASLVAYSDSEAASESDDTERASKKRKTITSNGANGDKQVLPPLPTTFHDLYSSTVRTSTHDDPSLHGGRKRVTPHVEGRWPTHVYLEWLPSSEDAEKLNRLISNIQQDTKLGPLANGEEGEVKIQTLLHNHLGVPLPLHVSLSRPLVLRTEQREAFLDQLQTSISSTGVKGFVTRPALLRWHPNESKTRWFLVLALSKSEKDELPKLLAACNGVAERFGQALLYHARDYDDGMSGGGRVGTEWQFHVSIAWSLQPPLEKGKDLVASSGMPHAVKELEMPFAEVKVRIGQDVTCIKLIKQRRMSSLLG